MASSDRQNPPSVPLTPTSSRRHPQDLSPFQRFCANSLTPLNSTFVSPPPNLISSEPKENSRVLPKTIKKFKLSQISTPKVYKGKYVEVEISVVSNKNDTRTRAQTNKKTNESTLVKCSCRKTSCLKLYCECFAKGAYCISCGCKECMNLPEFKDERQQALQSSANKNTASTPHIEKRKTCKCVKSACLKNYCECFQAKRRCASTCKCQGCQNLE